MKGQSFIYKMGTRKVWTKLKGVKMLASGPTSGGNEKP